MAKEIKNQEVMEEMFEEETTAEENAEETTVAEPKKKGFKAFVKKHKGAFIAGAAALVVGGIGAVVKYCYTKPEATDEESDDVIDSTDVDITEF